MYLVHSKLRQELIFLSIVHLKDVGLAELDYALLEEHAIPTIKQPVSVNQQDEYDLHSYKQSNINQDLWASR